MSQEDIPTSADAAPPLETEKTADMVIDDFVAAIRTACASCGFNFELKGRTIGDMRKIASIAEQTASTAALAEALHSDGELQLDLRRVGGEGSYAQLERYTRLVPQRAGQLVFACIDKGEAPRSHTHRSPAHKPELPGEITATLQGTLRYKLPDDSVGIHTKNNPPRISPGDSGDEYLPQQEDWRGFYIQWRGAD